MMQSLIASITALLAADVTQEQYSVYGEAGPWDAHTYRRAHGA